MRWHQQMHCYKGSEDSHSNSDDIYHCRQLNAQLYVAG